MRSNKIERKCRDSDMHVSRKVETTRSELRKLSRLSHTIRGARKSQNRCLLQDTIPNVKTSPGNVTLQETSYRFNQAPLEAIRDINTFALSLQRLDVRTRQSREEKVSRVAVTRRGIYSTRNLEMETSKPVKGFRNCFLFLRKGAS